MPKVGKKEDESSLGFENKLGPLFFLCDSTVRQKKLASRPLPFDKLRVARATEKDEGVTL